MSGAAISLFHPGDSHVHRAPVGVKLAVLAGLSAVAAAGPAPWAGVAVLAVAAGAAAWTRIPPGVLLRRARPPAVMILLLTAVQVLLGRTEEGIAAAARLSAIAAVALVFAATTSAPQVAAFVERSLLAMRVRPDRVLRAGLVVGLAMRAVDHLVLVAAQVRDARRARGLQRSLRAFAVPTVVAAARFAHGVGEALEARGLAPSEGAEDAEDVR